MGYYLEFKKITLDMFFDYLTIRRLFKTHMVLKENLNSNKKKLISLGYTDLDSLYTDIKTQKKVDVFSEKYNFSNEYITVLRRHIMSLIAKKRKITDFIRMKDSTMTYLLSKNIMTTLDLYHHIDELECDEIDYLTSIVDLVRLRYLHATFLDGLYFSGYKSIKDLANADYHDMTDKVNESMIKYKLSKAKLGLKDSEYLVEDAKLYLKWLSL